MVMSNYDAEYGAGAESCHDYAHGDYAGGYGYDHGDDENGDEYGADGHFDVYGYGWVS